LTGRPPGITLDAARKGGVLALDPEAIRVKPQLFALLTAAAWGIGGYFEKKGLHAGNLPPQVGITIRTAVALVVLSAVSWPQWRSVATAGGKSLVLMVIGGGVVAGSVGMLCFYTALKGAPINRVMPLAFTSPLFGALAALVLGGEALTLKEAAGMVLTIGGIALLTT
jgi:transporter family protein